MKNKFILLSVNGVGVISKNNFLFTSFERTVGPMGVNEGDTVEIQWNLRFMVPAYLIN